MKYSIIDAHCDTAYELYRQAADLKTNHLSVSLDLTDGYDCYLQIFAVWSDPLYAGQKSMIHTQQVIEYFKHQLEKHKVPLILGQSDLKEHSASKGLKGLLAIEGGEPIGDRLENLDLFYHSGVRLITLTWNGTNAIGSGSLSGCQEGLTDFGRQVVKRMHQLGMIVDVSHLNEQGFYDVLEIAMKPIVASHSNAQAVHPHKRNLSDGQFRGLMQNKGVIGLNIYPPFLGGEKNLSALIAHLEHLLSLGGEDHIGIGTDFDGIDCAIPEISNAGELYRFADRLLQLNYSDCLVQKLLFDNMYRVICENLNI